MRGRDAERENIKERGAIKAKASSVVSIERTKWPAIMERKGEIMPVAVVSVEETDYPSGR